MFKKERRVVDHWIQGRYFVQSIKKTLSLYHDDVITTIILLLYIFNFNFNVECLVRKNKNRLYKIFVDSRL